MSESADYDPGPWAGYSFHDARAAFDVHAGRSYSDAVSVGKTLTDVLPTSLETDSDSPLVIVCDVTGSMGEWPAVIFSKLPYLELEGQEYLGKDMEICFAAVGDAHHSDKYPLQAREFTAGTDLKKCLKELVIEGGGGSQTTETYELAALYFARNVEMPNAVRPILIFIGDEQPYDVVTPDDAARFHVKLEKRLTTEQVFAELKRKYAVYLIRKPYEQVSGNVMGDVDRRIYAAWERLLGDDHIANLPEAQRVVDVIFGILAKETGRVPYFKEELEGRQLPDEGGAKKVATVFRSLDTIHKLASGKRSDGRSGKSVLRSRKT